LRFNGIRGDETDYFFSNYFNKWIACAVKEFYNLKRKNNISIFRKYGSVNINEFFSVLVETFFENPLEFKQYNIELYNHTSVLLNQTFTDDGSLLINCRQDLLNKMDAQVKGNYTNALSYYLNFNGSSLFAIGFMIVGLFSLSNQGYLYPSPYILFAIALLAWLYFEKNYTRIHFTTTNFTVEKGYKLIKGYKKSTLPYAKLVSLTATFSKVKKDNTLKNELNSVLVIYFEGAHFYEVELFADALEPNFFELCKELKHIYTHVFIRSRS